MTILKSEHAGECLGVKGRFHNVIQWPHTDGARHSLRIANQIFVSEARKAPSYGPTCKIVAEIRFDDNCKNGHESFAITAHVYRNERANASGDWEACGCLHDDIAHYFPEFAPLIKWHHMNSDGPMHYVANVVYHASNLHNDYAKGEPCRWESRIYVGNSPFAHKVGNSLLNFIRDTARPYELVAVPYVNDKTGYDFDPKYTLKGMEEVWHKCPFDEQFEAETWLKILNGGDYKIEKIVTEYSKGKERDLDAARSCAIWPEATDEQLCLPADELKVLLQNRLGALIAEFKGVIESIGFLWSAE